MDRATVEINSASICGLHEAHKKLSSVEMLGRGERDASGKEGGWRATERVTKYRDGRKGNVKLQTVGLISPALPKRCNTHFRV